MHSYTLPPTLEQDRSPRGFCDAQFLGTTHTVFHSHSMDKVTGLIYKVLREKKRNTLAKGSGPHLLAILMLQVQPGLDVTSGLLKGLALRHFSRVVCADADDIGAEKEHHISTEL